MLFLYISYTLHQFAVTRVEVSVSVILIFFLMITVHGSPIDHIEQEADGDATLQLRR